MLDRPVCRHGSATNHTPSFLPEVLPFEAGHNETSFFSWNFTSLWVALIVYNKPQ